MEKYNHELLKYDFKEGSSFEGLIPSIMDEIGSVGHSDVVVKMHGCDANGADSLEVIDVEKYLDSEIDNDSEDSAVSEPDFSQPIVVLGKNYSPETPIVINNDTTLKLNKKTIIAPLFTEDGGNILEGNTDSYGLWVKSGNLVIEGEGEVIAQDAKYSMSVWANGGSVEINGGVFRNGGDNCDLIYASNGGNVVINGGEFFPKGPASGEEPGTKNTHTALNVKDSDYKKGISSIVVKGGVFHNFNPANNLSEGPNTNFVADGYESIEISENVWEVRPIE